MQGTEKIRLYSSVRLCAGVCCAPLMDGYLITSVGLVWFLSDFVCADNSPWLVGFSAFAYIFGSFFGTLFGGWIGDRMGRRALYNCLPFCLAALCAMQTVCTAPISLIAVRFLLGFVTGADSPCSQAMAAENSPKQVRAKTLTWLMNAWFIGAILSACIAWFIKEMSLSWMVYPSIAAVLALISAWARMGAPESVLWLLHHGRGAEAEYSLAILGLSSTSELTEEESLQGSTRFNRRTIGKLIFISVFWFCQAAPVTAVLMFGPLLLSAPDMSGETEFASTTIAYLLFFIGSFGALGLIGQTKRRPLILWTFALMALGFLMLSQVHLGSKLMLWAALAIYSLPYGIQSVLDYVYPSELFSTSIRATALGILGSTSRVGSMISSLLFPIAFISYGQQAMCFVGAFVLAVGFAVSYFYAPKTHSKTGI